MKAINRGSRLSTRTVSDLTHTWPFESGPAGMTEGFQALEIGAKLHKRSCPS